MLYWVVSLCILFPRIPFIRSYRNDRRQRVLTHKLPSLSLQHWILKTEY